MKFQRGGLDNPSVLQLLETHLSQAGSETAPESAHALDLQGLKQPDVDFWSMWWNDELVAIGAIRKLSADHYEVKSMHTISERRRSGIGSEMLLHLIRVARTRGVKRLSLETGSWDFFRPARALYSKFGFIECQPFANYVLDPNSVFMTLDLTESLPEEFSCK